ncbi:CU044_2847 family protein [Streptomyces sp. NPDC018693]|uniref:CU044_2847 family protein n=1 Tax=unclassified Streptomyces TaxID=2593676 RepID=UPI0037B72B31
MTQEDGGAVDGLVEFRTEDGVMVTVETGDERTGSRLASRGDGVARATRTFEQSLDGVRAAAESALRVFRDGSLRPDGVEIEFGVKLSAETGAIIAKGAAEGHLVVRLSWSPGSGDDAEDAAIWAAAARDALTDPAAGESSASS